MRFSQTSIAGLAAVALLVAACSSSASTPVSQATQAASTPTPGVAASAAPQLPPAPTDFTATRKSGSVPCPSSEESCSQTDLAWQSAADQGTTFRIYTTGTSEDPSATCLTVQASAKVRLDTQPGATSAQIFDPMAVGGGQICWWIASVNDAGESAKTAAAGQ